MYPVCRSIFEFAYVEKRCCGDESGGDMLVRGLGLIVCCGVDGNQGRPWDLHLGSLDYHRKEQCQKLA